MKSGSRERWLVVAGVCSAALFMAGCKDGPNPSVDVDMAQNAAIPLGESSAKVPVDAKSLKKKKGVPAPDGSVGGDRGGCQLDNCSEGQPH